MATKATPAAARGKKKPAPAPVDPLDREKLTREILLSPAFQGAAGMEAWESFAGKTHLPDLVEGLREQTIKIQSGNTKPIESMLWGQAQVLQTLFTNLSRRASKQEQLKQFQTMLTLAMKAQAQCRVTLQTLSEIKSPRPVAFVRQANINQGGNQQINNGQDANQGGGFSRAENSTVSPNELLGVNDGNYLDTGAPSAASQGDPLMATLGAQHRSEDARG